MFHSTLTMYCNRPQLTVQQMVNVAWLFTFYHWTHGCDVNVVKNHLKYKQEIVGVSSLGLNSLEIVIVVTDLRPLLSVQFSSF